MIAALLSFALSVGAVVGFIWALATLGNVRRDLREALERLDRIEQALGRQPVLPRAQE